MSTGSLEHLTPSIVWFVLQILNPVSATAVRPVYWFKGNRSLVVSCEEHAFLQTLGLLL